MHEEIPFGAPAPSGRFRCLDCGQEMFMSATDAIPPCPNLKAGEHHRFAFERVGPLAEGPREPLPEHS